MVGPVFFLPVRALVPPPFSFLEREKRGQLKKRTRKEWEQARREERKLDQPPGPPPSQPEPTQRKPGKLRREFTNTQPQSKGFEQGMFPKRNLPYIRTFTQNLHMHIIAT